jgi:hypothetical protein
MAGATDRGTKGGNPTAARWSLIVWTVALAAFGIGYRVIEGIRVEQTSLLFIGLPAAVAILLTLLPPTDNAVFSALKGITIAIGMSGALLGEGVICVLMAAPLFYLVGLIVGIVGEVDKRRSRTKPRILPVLLLPLLVMSMEGVKKEWSFSRNESVTVERVFDSSREELMSALAAPAPFDEPLPTFLRLGFPTPQWIRGDGLEIGDRRVIRFAGGEGEPGNLTLEVVESTPNRVRFRSVEDDSKIAHWLGWKESTVTMTPERGGTRVRWTLAYDRRLDPAWYFGPIERYAVGLAAEVLIENLSEE